MRIIEINLPITEQKIAMLEHGDKLLLNGKIMTARDAAHKRMIELFESGGKLPFDIGQYPIYYCGPTPARAGFPIGACGPTTSGRMDKYVPRLFKEGLRVMIGKGTRCEEVMQCIKEHNGLYISAIGGAGALYGRCVTSCNCILWEDLGTEAIYMLEVKGMVGYVI